MPNAKEITMSELYQQYEKYRTQELTEMEKFSIDRTKNFSLDRKSVV